MTDLGLIDLRSLFNRKMAGGQLSGEDLHYAIGQQPFHAVNQVGTMRFAIKDLVPALSRDEKSVR
jgi:hypothetical protein